MDRVLAGIAVALLIGQVVWIGRAQVNGDIYGNWAMFHTGINYEARATVNGVTLTSSEFKDRYQIPARGFNGRSVEHLAAVLSGRELAYGEGQRVALSMSYAENGGETQEWLWQSAALEFAWNSPVATESF